jgi:hypothetical protein
MRRLRRRQLDRRRIIREGWRKDDDTDDRDRRERILRDYREG